MAQASTPADSSVHSLDEYFPQGWESQPGARVVKTIPPAPSKYALYQHGGEACSGHYDHGEPMPLRVRVEFFLEKHNFSMEHARFVTDLVRSTVRRNERYLKAHGPLDPESLAVLNTFYADSTFFGIPTPPPDTTRCISIPDSTLQAMLQPTHKSGKPSVPVDAPILPLSGLLSKWVSPETDESPARELHTALLFGPSEVVFHAPPQSAQPTMVSDEPTPGPSHYQSPTKSIATRAPLSPSKFVKLQIVEYPDPDEQHDEISSLKSLHDSLNLKPILSTQPVETWTTMIRDILSAQSVEMNFTLGAQTLSITSKPAQLLKAYRAKFRPPTTPGNITPGCMIYSPPGHGKTVWLTEHGLQHTVIDTDILGHIDAREAQALVAHGLTLITNRSEFIPLMQVPTLVIFYDDPSELAKAMLSKMPSQEAQIKKWVPDIQALSDVATETIRIESGFYLNHYHDQIKSFVYRKYTQEICRSASGIYYFDGDKKYRLRPSKRRHHRK